jgi:hypothetical protein
VVINGLRLGRILVGLDSVGVAAEPAEGLGLGLTGAGAAAGVRGAGAVVAGDWDGVDGAADEVLEGAR